MKPIVAPGLRRSASLACMCIALAALVVPTMTPIRLRVVYNPSDSVARGWYSVDPVANAGAPERALHVGSIVLARLPADAAAFAAQRGYLPAGVPILKRIGAVAPQSVCIWDHIVAVDGAMIAVARERDARQLPLPIWSECRPLAHDELFLLSNTNPASFDSRYFGPIAASAVLGIARPLWTWGGP